ncbi:MAG: UDP-N-acetylglucosamine 1-carboxyvinyltransferase [Parcubacteria group bacterium Athens0714_26]|nr:MAG: UDP-N-acetylglucosamine 1-carboxyvinyltransferase [Parcubacteria group bacterium Athens1014_26]TSD03543.1 MAG: UDP-N-acetylglucosamine 1-carboxyvinyltransferase [Parcubacteria group bacterium Athens0714_26]
MRFIINGGRRLGGEIKIEGCKNAATPIIAATILSRGTCVLENIPRIGDVFTMLEILEGCGSKQKWTGDHTIEIKNDDFNPELLNQHLVRKIRSSILLVGPILARFGKIKLSVPGGCHLGGRPLDAHLESFKSIGAEVDFDESVGIYNISLNKPENKKIILKEFSVTATENLLMLASKYPLEIKLAACEPHVEDLGNFLKKMGMRIEGLGTHHITINKSSVDFDGEARYQIINDPIEAGTFAILAAATKSRILIKGVNADFLDAPLQKLKEFGAVFKIEGGDLFVDGSASVLKSAKVQTLPYPGLPTDLQAPFGVLATQAQGSSLIFDILYEGRLKYINELKKMGADAVILDAHRAIINGPTVLGGAEIESLDLRAGATLVIAALAAKGQSIIGNIEQIDRGYEKLDERLKKLGALIEREN